MTLSVADTDAADIPEATGDSDMENAEGESVASDEESTTNDSVIDIGKEDYLEIPETGQTEEINNPEEESTTSEETAGSAEELTYTAEAVIEDGSAALDFGSLEEGLENPEAKEVTIKNTGTGTLTFQEISPGTFYGTGSCHTGARRIPDCVGNAKSGNCIGRV